MRSAEICEGHTSKSRDRTWQVALFTLSLFVAEVILRAQVEPSRQRTPFIFQAGASKAGKPFAAASAEAMFIPGMDIDTVRCTAQDIRRIAVENGRDPDGIKLIVGMLIIVDETNELARAKYEEYLSYADLEGSLTLFGELSNISTRRHDRRGLMTMLTVG